MNGKAAATQAFLRLMAEKRWELAFFLIVLGGAFLRLRGLTFQSYWDDELFSVAVSDPHNSLLEVAKLTVRDVHPPVFQLLLWGWFKLFGLSEFSGRLFPALCGILSIFTMRQLGSEIGGRRVGLTCALLTAVNIFHLYYSQEVRSYSLLFLLGSLSLLTFIRLIRHPDNSTLTRYLTATIAMIYTHYFGLLALCAEAIVALWILVHAESDRTKKILIRAGIILAASLLPLAPFIIRSAGISAFWITPPHQNFVIEYFNDYFQSPLIAITCAIALLFGAIRILSDPSRTTIARILILWAVLIYLLPYVRSMTGTPMLTSRNTIIALPAIFAVIAVGFDRVSDRILYALLLMAFATVSVLTIYYEPPYYSTVKKPQIREAAKALINEHPDPGTVYAPREVVRNFNVYFSLFDAPFRARSLDDLLGKDGNSPSPLQQLWVIDGRAGPLFARLQNDKRLKALHETNFKGAAFKKMEFAR